jgi:acyl transferase domain-containing protein/acyl carrier protein/ribosomal protein S18 acetylase RimI-like enzyme/ubiquinone/menaquinone biosynthesis C-methylase UbiE
MLDVLNRYAHGFVVVPVVLACRRGGVLAALQEAPWSAGELSAHLRANGGHLGVALRVFESLGWIERRADGRFAATADVVLERLIPDDLWTLVEIDFDSYLKSGTGGLLARWCDAVRERWNCTNPLMADFMDGMLVVPFLALLAKRGVLRDLPRRDFNQLPEAVRPEAIALLKMMGWLEGSQGSFRLTSPGTFMFERAMNLAVAESYRPMLRAMDRLLLGDAASVFALDSNGQETHLDRSMNVLSSGFQHDRYFAEVEEILVAIFSREPLSSQPRYVADMGCGDGTFLRRVLTTVRGKTPRGRVLTEYPLILIGIDLNKASLEETSRRLHDLDHLVVPGDIGDPGRLVRDLRSLGVDPDDVLHIRSFLDHDRPFIPPSDQRSLRARAGARYVGVYADQHGRAIDAATVVQGLVEHLQRWTQAINKHGIILLEVHCQDPRVVRSHIDQSESLYFDAVQGFSQQLLVEADAALLAAAEAGLFPNPTYFKKFPRHLPTSRITLNLFERKDFRVRLATTEDLPALLRLEDACWSERLRVAASELEQRITRYPLGQLVIETGSEVLGVIYSQRIADFDRLRTTAFRDLASLHDEHGSIVQLLALNVLPESRHLGLGDQLLDFMLIRSSVQGGVRQVAGVTRCRDFRGHSLVELAAYVRERDVGGHPTDPILQFHHGHGAELLDIVEGFRPDDTNNLGAGVLLRYDLVCPGLAARTNGGPSPTAPATTGPTDNGVRLEACLRTLLGRRRESGFSWTLPFRDMGLDSLDLLGFRTQLQQMWGLPLSPTFFFSYPTLREIQSFFDGTPAPPATEGCGDAKKMRFDAEAPASTPGVFRQRAPAYFAQDRAVIAVVGIAGRFPGGTNIEDYWNVLAEGRDAVTEVPRERWDVEAYFSTDPAARGKIVSRHGGFLQRVDEFDPAFFNIAPRVAQSMDPQQRLLLEIHWEALENAGINPQLLRESACGIFVGLSARDYELLQVEAGGSDDLDIYHATGNSAAIAAGRVAYFLGTRGPALTLDTACSSSLVAVHQAIRSLRSGECNLAIASGVNLLLSPRSSIAFSQAGMLSTRGRCSTFDAGADGYVRAEGCGAVVLKRLEDAERDGDIVLAVLRGSAVNQDGASNGLTAPSLPAQQALLRSALADASLQPADIHYVEAHGTGTSLGDPIEFDALLDVFGGDPKRVEPLWIGSVKTNIGHAEAAAGIAGLIKVVLSLQREWLPAHLHFEQPNPHLDLDRLPAKIPVQGRPWRRGRQPLRAGVSSFGFSGTNAHVVVEQAPAREPARSAAPERSRHVLALSARSPSALAALAASFAEWLPAQTDTALAGICHAANAGRAHHDHRIAVTGTAAEEIVRLLREAASRALKMERVDGRPKVAFLFTGQGSQYPDMARELAHQEPAFRQALKHCCDLLRGELPRPLEDLIYPARGQTPLLNDTAITQPALFAIEYSLARMLQAWGVDPAAVMGHSVGEYVAACIAGVFTLEDALKLIAARGRLMGALPEDGAMLAVLCPRDALTRILTDFAELGVAAFNGPENIVVSGPRRAVDQLAQKLGTAGVRALPLQVSHAFHSPLMEPMIPAFRQIAEGVRFSAPRIEFISNLTGSPAREEITTADYWCRHIREPVRFEEGIHALERSGVQVMLEIGPHPVLTAMGQACVPHAAIQWLHTLSRGDSDWRGIVSGVAALYERGAPVDWRRFDAARTRDAIALPPYPWQRKSYWFAPANKSRVAAAPSSQQADAPDDWFYETSWVECPRDDEARVEVAPYLASPVELRETTGSRIAGLAATMLPAHEASTLEELENLAARHAGNALRDLGFDFAIGGQFETVALRESLGVLPRHSRLFGRLLEILAEDGILRRIDDQWKITSVPRLDPAPGMIPDPMVQRSDPGPEYVLLARCGPQLAGVLRGEVEPLTLLFPGDGTLGVETIYRGTCTARFHNQLTAELVAAAARQAPRGSTLRVLEIGGGTGSTTEFVLGQLANMRRSYMFTDVGRHFVNTARARFAADSSVQCAVLDIEKPPAEQGFAHGSADIVLAVNVLHATSDLRTTLQHARQLLAPGGLLVLQETTAQRRWLDLIFGLTEGWWRFGDAELRPFHALLSPDQWTAVLSDSGFVAPTAVAGEYSQGRLHEQVTFVARAGQATAPLANAQPAAFPATGRWLIFADESGLGERVAAVLEKNGGSCVMARPGGQFDLSAPHHALLRPDFAEDYHALLGHRTWRGILHCWSLDAVVGSNDVLADLDRAERLGCRSMLLTAKALLAQPPADSARLWVVTRGAQAAWPEIDVSGIGQAPVWGLGRTFAIEHPERWGGLIDVDPAAELDILAPRVCREMCWPDADDQLALGEAIRLSPRLMASRPPAAAQISIRSDALYLITGGLGGLGPGIARWLVERGARHLCICSQRALPERGSWPDIGPEHDAYERIRAIQNLECLGAEIHIAIADVADKPQMQAMFGQILAKGPRLAGIIHAAARIDFCAFNAVTPDALHSALRPKVTGSWLLHELSLELPLDFFVLFSSAATLLGARDLGHYAAANQFLDFLAHTRRGMGMSALSINWGAWDSIRSLGQRRDGMARFGLNAMEGTRALSAMSRLVRSGVAQRMIADIDWVVMKAVYETRGRFRFFDRIQPRIAVAAGAMAPHEADSEVSWHEQVSHCAGQDGGEQLATLIAREVRAVLGLDAAEPIDFDRGLFEMGLDSLMSVQLKGRLERAVGLALPATLTFTYPTVHALGGYLLREAFRSPSEPSTAFRAVDRDAVHPGRNTEPSADLDALSDQQVKDLLNQELDSLLADLRE